MTPTLCLLGGFAIGLAISIAADLGKAREAEALLSLGVLWAWTLAR